MRERTSVLPPRPLGHTLEEQNKKTMPQQLRFVCLLLCPPTVQMLPVELLLCPQISAHLFAGTHLYNVQTEEAAASICAWKGHRHQSWNSKTDSMILQRTLHGAQALQMRSLQQSKQTQQQQQQHQCNCCTVSTHVGKINIRQYWGRFGKPLKTDTTTGRIHLSLESFRSNRKSDPILYCTKCSIIIISNSSSRRHYMQRRPNCSKYPTAPFCATSLSFALPALQLDPPDAVQFMHIHS